MKTIQIIYTNQNALPIVKIDGRGIDKYSDLKIIEETHIHLIGNKLPKILKAEAEGNYNLHIIGNTFVYKFCSALLGNDQRCKEITFQLCSDITNIGKEASFLYSLLRKYEKTSQYVPMVLLSGSLAANIQHPNTQVVSQNSDWAVEENTDSIIQPTIVYNTEKLSVKNVNDFTVVYLPEKDTADFFDYLYERTVLIPAVNAAGNGCKNLPLSDEEKITLAAYSERTTKYLLELGSSEIEQGEKCLCKFRVYPVENSSEYLLDVQPRDAVVIQNDYLYAKSGSVISVRVLNTNGMPQEEHLINVIYHNYAVDIKVIPEAINTVIGEKASFEYYVIPSDAEDIKEIRVVAENPSLIALSGDRLAIGLAEGDTSIKIIAKNFVKRIPVSVKPKLKAISLNQTSCSVELGKEVTLKCTVNPSGAACEKPDWKMDNTKLGNLRISEDGMTCTFVATKDGYEKGKIICSVPGTEFEDSCEVKVTPIDQPTTLIALSWIFTGIGCIVGLFVFPLAAAGGMPFMGYFMDFFMPIGMVLALIGRNINNEHSNGNFTGCILLNALFSLGMILVGSVACSGLR